MTGDLLIESGLARPPTPETRPPRASGTRPPAAPQERTDAQGPPAASRTPGKPEGRSGEQFAADLQRQLAEIQARGSLRQLRLDYEVREEGVVVVKILDAETDKVIRTVPPEEQLELAQRLEEYLGLVLDETA